MKKVYPTLSLWERDRRWKAVRDLMKSKGLDCLLVAGLNSREQFEIYLSNDCVQGMVIFPLQGEPAYLAWSGMPIARLMEDLRRKEEPWIDDWRVAALGSDWAGVLKEKGFDTATIGVVGLESRGPGEREGYISFKAWSSVLKSLPRASFIDISQAFAELTLVKSAEELALIRHSAKIGEMACQAMLKAVKAGVSESKIAGAFMKVLFENAAFSSQRPLILHSGIDNPGWGSPKWLNQAHQPRLVKKGDLVQAEIFARYGGLETQQQMSVALKPVHRVNRECAKVARRSYEAGIKTLHPGRTFQEVAEAMEVPIAEAGCWHLTPLIHSMNPQIVASSRSHVKIEQLQGLEKYQGIKELSGRGMDLVIKPGMVFELEPNVHQERHRVNIGGTVLVTADGAEELNQLSVQMRIVD